MERNNQLSRTLAILRDLNCLEGVDLYELAERHGATVRTIRRDLQALQEVGFPISEEPGEGKRKKWRIGYSEELEKISGLLDASHYLALKLAMDQGGAVHASSALFARLEDLAAKIETALGENGRAELARIEACFYSYEKFAYKAAPPEVLWELVKAIGEKRICHVEYAAPYLSKSRSYDVLPLRIFAHQGGVYLFALWPRAGHVGTLNLQRLKKLQVLDRRGTPPADFDPTKWESAAFGIYGGGPQTRYVLRFDPEVAPYIRERVWHPSQKLRELKGGKVELEFTCAAGYEVSSWIASWRRGVEVLEPASERAEMLELGRWLVRSNQPGKAGQQLRGKTP
jgi:predicted DNA-binding transcriptional regulator YafY